jgi:hypothetical protein
VSSRQLDSIKTSIGKVQVVEAYLDAKGSETYKLRRRRVNYKYPRMLLPAINESGLQAPNQR